MNMDMLVPIDTQVDPTNHLPHACNYVFCCLISLRWIVYNQQYSSVEQIPHYNNELKKTFGPEHCYCVKEKESSQYIITVENTINSSMK